MDDLDICTVADEQVLIVRRVDEFHLDFHRARLLFQFQHIRGDALDLAGEGLALDRIQGDAAPLPHFDAGCIHFIDRRTDEHAAVVDQVDRRQRQNAGWRWRGVFAPLAADVCHAGVEWRAQYHALQAGTRHVNTRMALGYLAACRRTGCLPGLRIRIGAFQAICRNKAALAQLPRALRCLAALLSDGANLIDTRRHGLELLFRQLCLSLQILVPQFQQHLVSLDALALLHQQTGYLPARRSGKLGAATGLDRTRAREVPDCNRARSEEHT